MLLCGLVKTARVLVVCREKCPGCWNLIFLSIMILFRIPRCLSVAISTWLTRVAVNKL